jgi:hypothetical protein
VLERGVTLGAAGGDHAACRWGDSASIASASFQPTLVAEGTFPVRLLLKHEAAQEARQGADAPHERRSLRAQFGGRPPQGTATSR